MSFDRLKQEVEKVVKPISKKDNNTLMMKGAVNSKLLGADFQPLSEADLKKYDLTGGVRILNIQRGAYLSQLGLPEGFIIYKFNLIVNCAYSF